jgi:hypothetical protein
MHLFHTSLNLTLNSYLTSRIITVTVTKSRTFYLHLDLLVTESDKFSRQLHGAFKEATECAIEVEDEDPELFGFFVEYLYRNQSILSRDVGHYSEYVTLARLYAMGERLSASSFQAHCLWRFTQSLGTNTAISEECVCDLLQIACTEITERVKEDPMRSQIFWYGGVTIAKLQKSGMFSQLLFEVPEVGKQLCLWVNLSQPPRPAMPNELEYKRFMPESEYSMKKSVDITPMVDDNEQDGSVL